ncbi:unnamed protein product [Pleuronectes platessa]|uniref:Uncharacterized protein n=1 Tax=Pleuronectes platessa TaxID=8262 RepID=A0A9N7UT23_PLEPL|nr:unnamed protein product [Pleuronectes platessa]
MFPPKHEGGVLQHGSSSSTSPPLPGQATVQTSPVVFTSESSSSHETRQDISKKKENIKGTFIDPGGGEENNNGWKRVIERKRGIERPGERTGHGFGAETSRSVYNQAGNTAFIILSPFSATPRCEETHSSRPPLPPEIGPEDKSKRMRGGGGSGGGRIAGDTQSLHPQRGSDLVTDQRNSFSRPVLPSGRFHTWFASEL